MLRILMYSTNTGFRYCGMSRRNLRPKTGFLPTRKLRQSLNSLQTLKITIFESLSIDFPQKISLSSLFTTKCHQTSLEYYLSAIFVPD